MELKIAVLAGDGIGPEIMEQALSVLNAVARKFGHVFTYEEAPVGAHAIDLVGDPYPASTHAVCMESDAVLFAAVGSLKYDNDPTSPVRPEQGLLAMRKQLGLFANIRPVATFPCLLHKSPLKEELLRGADFIVIRELTGGMYFGEKYQDNDRAYDTDVYTRPEIERILRVAFETAMTRRGPNARHRGPQTNEASVPAPNCAQAHIIALESANPQPRLRARTEIGTNRMMDRFRRNQSSESLRSARFRSALRIPARSGSRAASRIAPVSNIPRTKNDEHIPSAAPVTIIAARAMRPCHRCMTAVTQAIAATALRLKNPVVRPMTDDASSSVETSPRSGVNRALPAARQP